MIRRLNCLRKDKLFKMIEVLNNKINGLSAQLGNDEQIKDYRQRIAELKEQESTL